jgi:SAM-dependent methyltransferase
MTENMTQLKEFLESLQADTFISCTCSSAKVSSVPSKITIRSVAIKNGLQFQISEQIKEKIYHKNTHFEELITYLLKMGIVYKQILIQTTEWDYQVLCNKKQIKILKKQPTKSLKIVDHNKSKNRILVEGHPTEFLYKLGIMDSHGQIKKGMRDKFVQVNRFLETIQDVIPALKNDKLFVVDYGCGSALLTFALYHFIHDILKKNVEMIGLDLKNDVITKCQDIAKDLGYYHLKFKVQNIHDHTPHEQIDLIVSLHACDTATDAVLEKGIRWNVPVILAVPCCQKQLLKQIENPQLHPLLKHGVLKERFAALVTDAARAQFLTMHGYNTDVIEFIDMEHTPKNVMIRAIKHTSKVPESVFTDYEEFTKVLNIKPYLERTKDEKNVKG